MNPKFKKYILWMILNFYTSKLSREKSTLSHFRDGGKGNRRLKTKNDTIG